VLTGVERWLLPGECLLCRTPNAPGTDDPLVCGLCRARWAPIPDPVCSRCGQPSDGDLECRVCEEWPPALERVRSAVWLSGTARAAVHFLKYRGWHRVSEALAPAMIGLAPLRPGAMLVPVPLGAARRRERGYNQCDVLAAALGAAAGLPVRRDVLRRTRDTDRQTGLAPDARRANVTGAFTARWRGPDRPVLVDDVFTTGATLVAAANALLEGGAAAVEAVTFARARRPLDDDVETPDATILLLSSRNRPRQ
jgi:ComF family protein